jgi:hypothetical protein
MGGMQTLEPINLYELKEILTRDEILICFAGPFSHSIIEELGTAVKRYLEAEQVAKASLMSVFSVFIEQAQNVKQYAERKAAEGSNEAHFEGGIVVIGKRGDNYVVSSGNFVHPNDMAGTVAQLDRLRELDPRELKVAYKEQLRRNRSEGESAGLGLIDMARKTSEPLHYELKTINDQHCFFSLKAII